MYIDSYVISSLLIVILTVGVIGYIGWFGYRHIRDDLRRDELQHGQDNDNR